MKFSEITTADIADYLRCEEERELGVMLSAARSFVLGYTGLTELEADMFEDLTIAVYVLCGDMYDSRTYTVESDKVNPIAESAMNMHARNLI